MRCSFWDGIRININPSYVDKVIAYKCPISLHIQDEILAEWSYSDIENMTSIKEELMSAVQSWSKNHHREIHQVAKVCNGVPECWCEPSTCELNHIQVSFSTECNLHCRFCGAKHIRNSVVEKGLSKRLNKINFEFLYKLKNLNLEYIRLTDYGEPFFFYKDTIDWISQLTKEDTKNVFITTNATLLQDDFFELIEKKREEGITIDMHVSLNAYSQQSYLEKMGSDYFYKVIKNIFKLYKTQCPLRVSFLIDDTSDIDNYKNFLTFFSSLGIQCQIYPANDKIDVILKNKTFEELKKLY